MKRGELEKRQGSKLTNQMRAAGNAYGRAIAPEPDRRAQRDRDRALGLVPFAVKLPQELVKALQEQASEKERRLERINRGALEEKPRQVTAACDHCCSLAVARIADSVAFGVMISGSILSSISAGSRRSRINANA